MLPVPSISVNVSPYLGLGLLEGCLRRQPGRTAIVHERYVHATIQSAQLEQSTDASIGANALQLGPAG
jgi:hypothetical protein